MNTVKIRLYETDLSIANTEGTIIEPCLLISTSQPTMVYYLPAPQYTRIQCVVPNLTTIEKRTVALKPQILLTPEIYWRSSTRFRAMVQEKWTKLHYVDGPRTCTSHTITASKHALALVDTQDAEQEWGCQLHTKITFSVSPVYEYQQVENYDDVAALCAVG